MSERNDAGRAVSRRTFLGASGLGAAALALDAGCAGAAPGGSGPAAGYGPLVADPGGVLDLPRGFQYRVISPEGEKLSGGAPVPGDHDGMAALPGPGNSTVLVRNHELDKPGGVSRAPVPTVNPYDPTAAGGTTGIVVASDRTEVRDFVTSSGTKTNCAGGPTPWGTWLTCEETRDDQGRKHGHVFEVDPADPNNDLSAMPIRAMGFFSHEANGIDPETGIVYLTEDDFRGDIPPDPTTEVPKPPSEGGSRTSFLYRYVPDDTSQQPGALQKGGTLQALAVEEKPSYNADLAGSGDRFHVVWRTVDPEEAHADALAKGCARFNRLEGADFKGGAFWFDDTAGGEERLGQVFRLLPGEGAQGNDVLELFYEGSSVTNMQSPDNVTITPFGDLWFCEDGDGADRVMGITPDGRVYPFARNAKNDSELCGCTFSPDGRTFFVNIQSPGMTFAIWGPFAKRNRSRQRGMAHAAPPRQFAPQISGELAESADRHGLGRLEAAAYDRLGVPLA